MARETPQKTVPKLVELPSSNLCVTSIGAAIFILTLNHAKKEGNQVFAKFEHWAKTGHKNDKCGFCRRSPL